MNQTNFQKFSDLYRQELLVSVRKNPDEYLNCPKDPQLIEPYVDVIANRILTSITKNTIYGVHLSNTVKRVAKRLDINSTYKAIHEYLNRG